MIPALLPIEQVIVEGRFRQELGDLTDLQHSLATLGLLHPIVVTADHRLVAGHRRLEAARALGWDDIPAHVAHNLDTALLHLEAERDENVCRKEMTPSERVALGRAIEELERPKAKAAQGTRTDLTPELSVPRNERFDTREVVAPAVGMSTATYTRARRLVVDSENPELPAEQRMKAKAAVVEMDRTGKVTRAYENYTGKSSNQGLEAPTTRARPRRGHRPDRVITNAVHAIEGIAIGVRGITADDLAGIPSSDLAAWAKQISDALGPIRALRDLLKEQS